MAKGPAASMHNTLVLVVKIVALFLVIMVGWLARRRNVLDARTTSILSTFTTDLALPAMIFTQMLITVNAQALRESWFVPLAAACVLVLGQLVGWAGWRVFATPRQAPTFIFVIAITNWIYLPYPIIQDLYGEAGIRILLLSNAGVQFILWTMGIATLEGRLDLRAMKNLLKNPGLIATVSGVVVALYGPTIWPAEPTHVLRLAGKTVFEALTMVGSLTIPLSLIATGAQLGGLAAGAGHPGRALTGVVLLRLIVTPLIAIAIVWGIWAAGSDVPYMFLAIPVLMASMPVAVSCSILTERFRQDTALAAQSIFYTTLLSIVTVPVMFGLFNWLVGR